MLHVVSNSAALDSCQRLVREEDAVLFMGKAAGSAKNMDCSATYAIEADLPHGRINPPQGVECIGYDKFVDLVVEHTNCVTWS